MIEKERLLAAGKKLPISAALFYSFAKSRVINTGEACEILNCSRQNLAYLAKSGQLTPLKQGNKETLFLAGEVERAGW